MATETSLREDEKSIRLFKSDFLEFLHTLAPSPYWWFFAVDLAS